MKRNYARIIIIIAAIFAMALVSGIMVNFGYGYVADKREKDLSEFELKYTARRNLVYDDNVRFNKMYDIIGRPQNYAFILQLEPNEGIAGGDINEWAGVPLWLDQRDLDDMLESISSDRIQELPLTWENIIYREAQLINTDLTKILINDLMFQQQDTFLLKQAKINMYFALAYYKSTLDFTKLYTDEQSGGLDTVILGLDGGKYREINVGKDNIPEKILQIYHDNGTVLPDSETVDITGTFLVTRRAFYNFVQDMSELYHERILLRYYMNHGEDAVSGYENIIQSNLDTNLSDINRIFTRVGNNILIAMETHFDLFLTDINTGAESERHILQAELDRRETVKTLVMVAGILFNLAVLSIVIRILTKAYRKLHETQDSLTASNEFHKYIASHDILTNLNNKTYLREEFNRLILGKENYKLALIFIDLDNFKNINDIMGHNVGDNLLVKVAEMLKKLCRDCEVVARVGGDEFVVMKRYDDISEIEKLGKALVEAFRHPFNLIRNKHVVTPSIGGATYPANGWDFQEVYKNADTAMYESKFFGKNRFTLFSTEMHKDILNTYDTLKYLRNFEEYVYLEFQPLIWLDKGGIMAFEALSRMRTEERNIPPSEFVPLAVEHGLIIDMGYHTLRKACVFIKGMKKKGVETRVSVNISASQIYEEDFVDNVLKILSEHEVKPESILFEFTEDIVINYDKSHSAIEWLVASGISVGIDDFGTGYSSLSYFHKLPLYFIKIDKEFAKNMGTGKNDKTVEAIITLSESFGIITCAEGIETKEQLAFFKKLKCRTGQGYLFSKSLTSEYIYNNIDKLTETIAGINESV